MRGAQGLCCWLGLVIIACGDGFGSRAEQSRPDALCVPDCNGVQCGPDGCGGSCGSCPPYFSCGAAGQCTCTPDCHGVQCGPDGCGGSCGSCPAGQSCDANTGQCQGCQDGELRCSPTDVSLLLRCRNKGWEALRCPGASLCADRQCRRVCDGFLEGHDRSAFCVVPHPDNGLFYVVTNDPTHWDVNRTVTAAVYQENTQPAPFVRDPSLPWPGAFRMNCPGGSASVYYALPARALRCSDKAKLTFFMGLKHAGLGGQLGFWKADFSNGQTTVAVTPSLSVPLTYARVGMTLDTPVVAKLDFSGNFNVITITLASSNPAGPCDPVLLNWLYLEVVL